MKNLRLFFLKTGNWGWREEEDKKGACWEGREGENRSQRSPCSPAGGGVRPPSPFPPPSGNSSSDRLP